MELLAPVKDKESGILAINCGADALYCSGPGFSARVAAAISWEDLKEIIEYAHLYSKKVYITLNTLIDDIAIKAVNSYLDQLVTYDIDGLIVQDIGLLKMVRAMYPDLEIHASTQMHIHNQAGFAYIKSKGLARAVVPREMTLKQIQAIKKSTSLSIETFVHGALCVSYSGQCLYSHFDNGGSGNKGACKQNCRQLHNIASNNAYNLSLRDLSLGNNVLNLEGIVDSLKIEGRLKSKEYLYSNISYYRSVLDGNENVELRDLVSIAYNRKFTRGPVLEAKDVFNQDRVNNHGLHVGHVLSSDKDYIKIEVFKTLHRLDSIRILSNGLESGLSVDVLLDEQKKEIQVLESGIGYIKLNKQNKYANNIQKGDLYIVKTRAYETMIDSLSKKYAKKVELDVKVSAYVLSPMILEVNGRSYTSEFTLEQASNKPMSKEDILKQLSKTNESPFQFNFIDVSVDDDVFVVKSQLNAFRRSVVEAEMALLLQREKLVKESYTLQEGIKKSFKAYKFMIRTYQQALLLQEVGIKEVYVDDLELLEQVNGMFEQIVPVLPRVVKDDQVETYLSKIQSYDRVMVSELGMYDLLKGKKTLEVNYSLNILNKEALSMLDGVENVILSYECKQDGLFGIQGVSTSSIVYSRLPYMIIDYPLEALDQQLESNDMVELDNNKEILIASKYYGMKELHSKKGRMVKDKELTVDYGFIVFTSEDSKQVKEVLNQYI